MWLFAIVYEILKYVQVRFKKWSRLETFVENHLKIFRFVVTYTRKDQTEQWDIVR